MIVTVEVKDDKVLEELMSFLKKHGNDRVEVVELKSEDEFNTKKLSEEIAEFISDHTMRIYNSQSYRRDKHLLEKNYKPAELQAIAEILKSIRSMKIPVFSFKVDENFRINVLFCNSDEDIDRLQNVINKIYEKYAVRNDLVILE